MGQTALEALRGLPFVENMESSHIERLASMAKEVGFEEDQVIFREGETGRQFYIVLTGKVALEITTQKGLSRVLTVEQGHELGWSFLLPNAGRYFRARALERVRALVFSGDELNRACEQDALFAYRLTKRVLRVVTERLEAVIVRFHDIYG